MSSINYDLRKIKAIIFDVDGVLSSECIPLSVEGVPMRMINTKDGYAINQAAKRGFGLAIITGGYAEAIRVRFEGLGIKHIYMKSHLKINDFNDYIAKTGYKPEEIAYVGDDIPDIPVMKVIGLPVAPADAVPEVKEIAKYISHKKGGEGVGRDLIQQILKAHDMWMDEEAFGW